MNKGIQLCRDVAETTAARSFHADPVDSESHVDWLESQLELLRQVGEAHYPRSKFASDHKVVERMTSGA